MDTSTNRRDPRGYPNSIRECWAVHHALRSLGFQAADIYVAIGQDTSHPLAPSALFVVLRTQDVEFVVTVGHCQDEVAATQLLDTWTEFVNLYLDGVFGDVEMNEIFINSFVMQNKMNFTLSLISKGIKLPAMMN